MEKVPKVWEAALEMCANEPEKFEKALELMEKKAYHVTILRTDYQAMVFKVEASSEEDAKELALVQAENTYFNRGNADYEVEDIQEVQK